MAPLALPEWAARTSSLPAIRPSRFSTTGKPLHLSLPAPRRYARAVPSIGKFGCLGPYATPICRSGYRALKCFRIVSTSPGSNDRGCRNIWSKSLALQCAFMTPVAECRVGALQHMADLMGHYVA